MNSRHTNRKTVANILISLLAFIIIVIPVGYYIPYKIHNYRPLLLDIHIGNLRYIGLVLIALGTLIISWGYLTFIFLGKGTPFHALPPEKLIIKGLYRYVRNPMLVGVLFVFFGESILFESTVIIIYMILGTSIYHLILVLFEEPQLRKRFGDSYFKYCKNVPRWIPRLTPYYEEE